MSGSSSQGPKPLSGSTLHLGQLQENGLVATLGLARNMHKKRTKQVQKSTLPPNLTSLIQLQVPVPLSDLCPCRLRCNTVWQLHSTSTTARQEGQRTTMTANKSTGEKDSASQPHQTTLTHTVRCCNGSYADARNWVWKHLCKSDTVHGSSCLPRCCLIGQT